MHRCAGRRSGDRDAGGDGGCADSTANLDCNADTSGYADGDTYPNTHSDCRGCAVAEPDASAAARTDPDSRSIAERHPDGGALEDGYRRAYPLRNPSTDVDRYPGPGTHCHANVHPRTRGEFNPGPHSRQTRRAR